MSIQAFFESSRSNWLKWIVVFPASILAYAIAYALTNVLFSFTLGGDEWFDKPILSFISRMIAAASGCYFAIYAALLISPSYKKRIARIILFILVLMTILSVFYVIRDWFHFDALQEAIGNFVGVLAGYTAIKKHED